MGGAPHRTAPGSTRAGSGRAVELSVSALVDTVPGRVAGLLATRPSSWLRPFLRLATAELRGGPGPRCWYRLGPVDGTAGAAAGGTVGATAGRTVESTAGRTVESTAGRTVVVPFLWWPHAEGPLFTRFEGAFVVGPVEDGTSLTLEGRAYDGDAEVNRATLASLVGLLTQALEDPRPGPP